MCCSGHWLARVESDGSNSIGMSMENHQLISIQVQLLLFIWANMRMNLDDVHDGRAKFMLRHWGDFQVSQLWMIQASPPSGSESWPCGMKVQDRLRLSVPGLGAEVFQHLLHPLGILGFLRVFQDDHWRSQVKTHLKHGRQGNATWVMLFPSITKRTERLGSKPS